MELLVELIMELVKCLGKSACTCRDYHLNFDEAVSDLGSEWGALNSRKEAINSMVRTKVLWGKEVKHEVQGWLERVEEINKEVQAIQEKIRRVKWHSRGCLGKLVCKKIEVVKKIREQGCFPDGLVVDRPPTCGVIMSNDNPVGEDSAKEKIWGYLVGNEVRKIGVCGIGGVGKTTIMKHINDELVREAKFDKVIWVTVSYPLDVIKLQENIAHAITEDDTQRLPGGEDKERRAAELKSVMGRVRHVLILDDVWEVFSLIEIEGLVEGWIDEGLIDVLPSRKAAYDRGHAFLNMLVKKCLLEKTVDWCGVDVFRMHDVMRDMAIKSIGPEFGYMVKAGMKLTDVPDECGWGNYLKMVSLMKNNLSKIPLGLCPKCPTLSTLILSNNQNLSEIPESFFEGIPELKVLDLSNTGIEALPNSISNLEKLSSMRLRWCQRLRYLPPLAKLMVLKKLDLVGSGIKVVPQGMEKLISLEYLDLRYCYNLKKIPMGMLSNLSNLQYLSVYKGLKIKGEEVAGLKKLETFKGVFDDIQDYNHFVNSQDFQILTEYRIEVVKRLRVLPTTPREFVVKRPRALPITQRESWVSIYYCDLGEECTVLPDNLQMLKILYCRNMRSGLNKAALLEKATELSYCNIESCEDMECVIDLDSSSYPVLDKLEQLDLSLLPKLRMRKLLPLELLQAFQNLEEIDVNRCEQMEEIIASSDSDASLDKFTFPKLRRLWLRGLPQLKSICNAKGVIVCDCIEKIQIRRCRELTRIPVQFPLLDNGQPSHLKEIEIDEESKEWWESVEWDHKNLLQPFLKYHWW
ncbi:hypothetical protein SLEP1_g25847 [Rubroshorea leprosula]|uniref:Uncharacterized protein n=1 Tax=Rubroshorea leprosula TaxID=152421 RepID=A0AAV5JWH5_9ROSI|nr:hypothetical protein SLEP1_g25847 [Rubroshorea leprosula]